MEKFGQILFSIQGFPEKASNQKKQIFDKYYDQIFGEQNFDLSKSAEYVKRYFEIKKEYDLLNNSESSDQKIFYILYIDSKLNANIIDKINILENVIKSYNHIVKGKTISDTRKLLYANFKERLEEEIREYLNKK